SASAAGRRDVVVEAKPVLRVVLTLDGLQASEVPRAVLGLEVLARRFARVIQVAAAQSPRRQRLRVRARSFDLPVVLGRVHPDIDVGRVPARLSSGEGGRVRRHISPRSASTPRPEARAGNALTSSYEGRREGARRSPEAPGSTSI